MAYVWTKDYINSTLLPALDAAVLQTELGGNKSKINQFSYAGGKSSSSFGLYQYDVDGNPAVRNLLTQFGFTAAQITVLRTHAPLSANDQAVLNNQLATALRNPANAQALHDFDRTWAAGLINHLSDTLNRIAASGSVGTSIANQIYQSPTLQLQLLDYSNQFHISENGPMEKWLEGVSVSMQGGVQKIPANATLTTSMIQQFAMTTEYGTQHPSALSGRESRLAPVLNSMGSGTWSANETTDMPDDSPPVSPEIIQVIGNSATQTTTRVIITYPNGAQAPDNPNLDNAAKQSESGQSTTDGSNDGTAAGSINGDGGMLSESPFSGGGYDNTSYGGGSGGGGYGAGGDGDGGDSGGAGGGSSGGDGGGGVPDDPIDHSAETIKAPGGFGILADATTKQSIGASSNDIGLSNSAQQTVVGSGHTVMNIERLYLGSEETQKQVITQGQGNEITGISAGADIKPISDDTVSLISPQQSAAGLLHAMASFNPSSAAITTEQNEMGTPHIFISTGSEHIPIQHMRSR